MNNTKLLKIAHWLSYVVICTALAAIALHTASNAMIGVVWDDGYMFARYAHNILTHGAIAWNGSAPTYGLTSQLQLLLTTPIAALSNNPTVVTVTASLIGEVLFLILIPFLVSSVIPKTEKLIRRTTTATIFALVALGAYQFGFIATTGMDTMLSLAFLSLYLMLTLRIVPRLESVSSLALFSVGVLGGLAYLMRPDMMVFTTLIPLSLALWSQTRTERVRAWQLLAITFLTLIGVLFATRLYFGTALPLPFYAKNGALYGPTVWNRMKFEPILFFITFFDSYKYLFIAPVIFVLFGWRRLFKKGEHAIVIGLLASVAVWLLYYLFFVLQIMGYLGRFYYPLIPVLIALTSIALLHLFKTFKTQREESLRTWVSIGLCTILLVALLSPFLAGAQQFGYLFAKGRNHAAVIWKSNILAFYQQDDSNERIWPCLDVFAQLPDTATVATTEVGMPSAMSPEKFVLDLAGLNDTDIALQRTSVADAIEAHKIDLVYLPTEQFYPEQRGAILSSDSFKKNYTLYTRGKPVFQDVAIRNDSPYAATLTECLKENPEMSNTNTSNDGTQYYSLTFPYPLTTVK